MDFQSKLLQASALKLPPMAAFRGMVDLDSRELSGYYNYYKSEFTKFSDPMRVYRAVVLPSIEGLNIDKLGESWTWEEEMAISYNPSEDLSDEGTDFILSGLVKLYDVDWKRTMAIALGGNEESEIVIPTGNPVTLIGYRVEGDSEFIEFDVKGKA